MKARHGFKLNNLSRTYGIYLGCAALLLGGVTVPAWGQVTSPANCVNPLNPPSATGTPDMTGGGREASPLSSYAAGCSSKVGTDGSTAIGHGAKVEPYLDEIERNYGGERSVAIGSNANVKASDSVAIGAEAKVGRQDAEGNDIPVGNGVALGSGASVTGNNGVAIGSGASAEADGIAIGQGVTAGENQIRIGKTSQTDVLIGRYNLQTMDSSITTNTAGIATNRGNIATNTAGIARNGSAIAANRQDIDTNQSGVAMAIAFANLPSIASTRGNVGVAFGSFEGSTAGAVGANYNVTKNMNVKAGVSFADDSVGFGGGVGWGF